MANSQLTTDNGQRTTVEPNITPRCEQRLGMTLYFIEQDGEVLFKTDNFEAFVSEFEKHLSGSGVCRDAEARGETPASSFSDEPNPLAKPIPKKPMEQTPAKKESIEDVLKALGVDPDKHSVEIPSEFLEPAGALKTATVTLRMARDIITLNFSLLQHNYQVQMFNRVEEVLKHLERLTK